MKNKNFVLLDKNDIIMNIETTIDSNFNVVDLSESQKIEFNFDIPNNKKIKINWLSMSKNINKKINITITTNGKNNNIDLNSNSLLYENSNISFNVCAKNKSEYENSINLKISALLNDDKSKFSACPIFDFTTNSINAKHSVNVGGLNKEELSYIMSRGINENIAKKILITSKIESVVQFLDKKQKQIVNSMISKITGTQYGC